MHVEIFYFNRNIVLDRQLRRLDATHTLNSLRCSRTCHEIPDIVRLRNCSQKLVLISRIDTRICVSISDWLVS